MFSFMLFLALCLIAVKEYLLVLNIGQLLYG